jgi:hypothetical protein
LVAGSEVVKRLKTSSGVPDSGGAAYEYPNTFAIVGTRYTTIRVGPTACAIGASPKQTSTSGVRNPALTGLIGFLTGGVVVLNRINGFIGLVIFLSFI